MSFHVPPERDRIPGVGGEPGQPAGAFLIDSVEPGWRLALICDDGQCADLPTGWEHVSVRAYKETKASRIPTWREMCHVKALCWDADDVVVQYHPAQRDYVNRHPHVLHLWRPLDAPLPTPPIDLV